MWLTWCQKIQKLLARSLFEIHTKMNFSPGGRLVASIWAWYWIFRNSVVALVWRRACFGVCYFSAILWKSVSCSLIQHCSSLGGLLVVLLIACFRGSRLMSWVFWHGYCWFAWQNLIENQQKVWQSRSHLLFSAWCHGSELGWLLGSGLCGWKDLEGWGRNLAQMVCHWSIEWKSQSMKYGVSSVLSSFHF